MKRNLTYFFFKVWHPQCASRTHKKRRNTARQYTIYRLHRTTHHIGSPLLHLQSPAPAAYYHQHRTLTSIEVLAFIFKIAWPNCSILYSTFYIVNTFLCVIIYTSISMANISSTDRSFLTICKLQVHNILFYFWYTQPDAGHFAAETCSCHL